MQQATIGADSGTAPHPLRNAHRQIEEHSSLLSDLQDVITRIHMRIDAYPEVPADDQWDERDMATNAPVALNQFQSRLADVAWEAAQIERHYSTHRSWLAHRLIQSGR